MEGSERDVFARRWVGFYIIKAVMFLEKNRLRAKRNVGYPTNMRRSTNNLTGLGFIFLSRQ
jgi:hypothetical protein